MVLATELQGYVPEHTRTLLVAGVGVMLTITGLALWEPRWRVVLRRAKQLHQAQEEQPLAGSGSGSRSASGSVSGSASDADDGHGVDTSAVAVDVAHSEVR